MAQMTRSLALAVLDARPEAHGAVGVGGVKASVGHAEPAAGLTGLVRLMLGLMRSYAPANAQLRLLNPHVSDAVRHSGGTTCGLPVQLGAVAAEFLPRIEGAHQGAAFQSTLRWLQVQVLAAGLAAAWDACFITRADVEFKAPVPMPQGPSPGCEILMPYANWCIREPGTGTACSMVGGAARRHCLLQATMMMKMPAAAVAVEVVTSP